MHFPWLDRLFGTYPLTSDGASPPPLGLNDNPVPEGWLPQLWYPAVRDRSKPSPDQAGYR